MSSTRYARADSPRRQERFASSFEGGLLANLVAKRCRLIERPETRAAVWLVQQLSWELPGGLADVARLMLRTLGKGEPGPEARDSTLADLVATLERIALDPGCRFQGELEEWEDWGVPVFNSDLAELERFRELWTAARPRFATTTISDNVFEALDYTREAKCLTLVQGESRLGKSYAAKRWCERQGGLARYVEVPPSNDDVSFFRAVAKALGVSSSLQLKAWETRARVEETLLSGDLVVVFDEAHYAWPQNWQRYAMPSRINWIMTALINRGVPVALVATPQFDLAQDRVEKLTAWNSKQFMGRLGHKELLPQAIPERELAAVARAILPECDQATTKALVQFAARSKARLGALVAVRDRARWFAARAGRAQASREDIGRVIGERMAAFDTKIGPPHGSRTTSAPAPRNARGGLASDFVSTDRRVDALEVT